MSVTIADILNAKNIDELKEVKQEPVKERVDFDMDKEALLDKYAPIAQEALDRYIKMSNNEDIGMAIVPVEVTVEAGDFVFLVQIDALKAIGIIVFPKTEGHTVLEVIEGVINGDEA